MKLRLSNLAAINHELLSASNVEQRLNEARKALESLQDPSHTKALQTSDDGKMDVEKDVAQLKEELDQVCKVIITACSGQRPVHTFHCSFAPTAGKFF